MHETIKYLNPYTLLIINSHGSIRELYTPFRVISTCDIGKIQSQSTVFVEDTAEHPEHLILFKIFENWYPYKYFLLPNPP